MLILSLLTAFGHAAGPSPVLLACSLVLSEKDETVVAGVGDLLSGLEEQGRSGD